MSKFGNFKLAFTDTETTGLNPDEHEIIEIATLIYDPVQDKIIKEWEKKVAPNHIETAQPKALEINGYAENPELYTGNIKSAMIKFNSLTKDCMIVGQNIEFDLNFIKKHMAEYNITPNFDRHRKLDIMSLVWFAIKDTDIQRLSLANLCDHFKISNVGSHRALTDCIRAFEVYRCLTKIYNKG